MSKFVRLSIAAFLAVCGISLSLQATADNVTTYSKPAVRDAWADIAGPSDLVDPGNSFTSGGWPQSSVPPARQFFNWVLNYDSNAVRYFSQRGIVDYDAAETYQQGSIVQSGGILYKSLTNNNVGHTPLISLSNWGGLSVQSLVGPVSISAASSGYTLVVASDHGSAMAVTGTTGVSALAEFAGNGNTPGTNSVVIGQDAAGASNVLARGNQPLKLGANAGGQVTIFPSGAVSIAAPTTATALTVNSDPGVEFTAQLGGVFVGDSIGLSTGGNVMTSGTNPLTVGVSGAGTLGLVTNSVFRETINSAGNVNINAPSSGTAFNANGISGGFAGEFAGSTSFPSLGLIVKGGTNSSDTAFQVNNAASNTVYFFIRGDGGIVTTTAVPNEGPGTIDATAVFANGQNVITSAVTTSEAFTNSAVNGLATLASPAFSGDPTAPTAAAGTNTNQIATTAFVQSAAIGTSSLAANGWEIAPSGKVTMWGFQAGTGSSPVTVTFPKSGGFPHGVFTVVITPAGVPESFDVVINSTSTFTVNSGSGAPFYWQATGD